MIDITNAKKELAKYVKNYDINDKKIKLKVMHIERTAQIARQIAENLKLEKEDIELAELIGLLHDIGRFEQIKRYHTFNDGKSINHGVLGTKILFEEGLIRKFIEDDKYDEIIKKSILNHNRNKKDIETSNERELLHTKIIRDADKADILYVLTFEEKVVAWEKEDLSEEKITDEIYREFMEDKFIDYKKRETAIDLLVCHFAYIFDLNFKYGLQKIKKEKYLEKIYNRFEFKDNKTKERMKNIYNMTSTYIDTCIKEEI